jgi:hypothetical protein
MAKQQNKPASRINFRLLEPAGFETRGIKIFFFFLMIDCCTLLLMITRYFSPFRADIEYTYAFANQ